MNENPIDVWRRRLQHLQRAEASTTGASEKFKLQQEIEEAKSKIRELESEGQRLGKNDEQPAASRGRQILDSLLHLKDFLPFLGLLAALIGYLIPRFNQPPGVIIAALFFLIWILYLGLKAYRAFGTTRSAPGPTALWRIIFDQLPPKKGERVQLADKVIVLIIYDASTESVFDSICKQYQTSVKVTAFKYTPNFDAASLEAELDASDAVYFFCTEAIDQDPKMYKVVNNWAVDHSHVPILAVNFLSPDAPYHWTFSHLPMSLAVSGLWELLARATERARQLRLQATTFRRVWGYTVLIAVLIGAGMIWSFYERQKRDIEQWDRMGKRDLYELDTFWGSLTPLRSAIQSLVESQKEMELQIETQRAARAGQPEVPRDSEALQKLKRARVTASIKTQEALNQFAAYVVKDIRQRQGVGGDSGSLAFWRKYKDSDGREYLVEVARSDGRDPTCRRADAKPNDADYYPIVYCAVEKESFVRWRKDLSNGAEASWSRHGEVNGYWRIRSDPQEQFLELLDHTRCGYNVGTHVRTGLLCLGVSSRDGSLKSGVCLSTDILEGFPREEWTKRYLYQAVTIMPLLPDDLLITDELRSKCEACHRNSVTRKDNDVIGFEK